MVCLECIEVEQSYRARLCITQIWSLPHGMSTVGQGCLESACAQSERICMAAGEEGVCPLQLGDQSKE